ncbi:MAG TPA: HlyD family efflux transporter periplasmic adaptor subunit [Chloroflexota bacterium]|nr:HlyD family efflux transporter periplasmic adaptor subunit [Chloroflexota bacterium]
MARTTVVSPAGGRVVVPKILVGALILVVILGILGVTGVLAQARQLIPGLKESAPTYQTTTVGHGNIEVSVIATGPVATVDELPLTFKTSGKLDALNAAVGDHVTKGEVLATLDTSDLQTALDQAKANLAQQQANLAKLEAGATSAQQEVAQSSVNSAKTSAADAQANVATTQASSAQDITAAQGSANIAQTGLTSAQAALASAQDQEQKGLAADQTAVTNAQKNLDTVNASVVANGPVLQQQLEKAKDDLWSAQTSRDATCGRSKGADCASANATVAGAETSVNAAAAQIDQSQKQGAQQIAQAQASLDQAKSQSANDKAKFDASIVSAQDQVKQAQATLANAETGVTQAQAKATATVQSAQAQTDQANGALKSAQANYSETVAPPTPADVAAAKAQVANAQAALVSAQDSYNSATLSSPISGTVAQINGAVGQWISGGDVAATSGSTASATALFTIVNLDDLLVTAQVNEADIGKVKVGDPVTYTVSAYPQQRFTGKVLNVQPIGTVVQNVVNYTVTCSIQSAKDATLYPGMTAAATIVSQQHNGVVMVPNTALSFAQSAVRDGLVQGAGGQQSGQNAGARPQGQRSANGGTNAVRGATAGQPASASGQRSTTVRNAASGQGNAAGQGNANRGIVLTLKGGQLVPVRVTLGITDGTNTEILSGLEAGQSIVAGAVGGPVSGSSAPNGPGGGRGGVFFGRGFGG